MYLDIKWCDSGNLFKNTKNVKGERNVIEKKKKKMLIITEVRC